MNRVMVDLETLGTKPGSVIISIGAVRFDEDGVRDEYYSRVDPDSCVDVGLKIDPSTVMWWLQQADEARAEICKPGKSLGVALKGFSEWLMKEGEVDEIWGDGATFDNVLLRCAYEMAGVEMPWAYWADRCYRTMKNLYPDLAKVERTGVHHHALDDARTQAERLIEMLKAVKEVGQ